MKIFGGILQHTVDILPPANQSPYAALLLSSAQLPSLFPQVNVHRQGFEHYRRSLLRDIANAEARVEAAAAARAARRAKERADRVGKHTRRGAQAQLANLSVGERGAKKRVEEDARKEVRKEAVASVFGKKKKKG